MNYLQYLEIQRIVDGIFDQQDKALVCLQYGCAGRITEIVKLSIENITTDGRYVYVDVDTLKNPYHPIRTLPIPIFLESWITQPILSYVELCKGLGQQRLFNWKSSRTARDRLHKYFKTRSHLLRHSRLTHLVKMHQFDSHRLQMFAGWRSPDMAKTYIHLDYKDLLTKFENK